MSLHDALDSQIFPGYDMKLFFTLYCWVKMPVMSIKGLITLDYKTKPHKNSLSSPPCFENNRPVPKGRKVVRLFPAENEA